jgi:hypothetical protein
MGIREKLRIRIVTPAGAQPVNPQFLRGLVALALPQSVQGGYIAGLRENLYKVSDLVAYRFSKSKARFRYV